MKIKKLIEYGLYALAFLFPLQTRLIFRIDQPEYLRISLYATDVLLLAILLFSFFLVLRKNKVRDEGSFDSSLRSSLRTGSEMRNQGGQIVNSKWRIDIIWFIIAGLELFIFISIFAASDKILALYHYGVFLLGVGLFWLISKAEYNRIKLIYSFIAGVFLQACLGIWQFASQASFSSKWLGLASHDPAVLGTSVVETLGGERWLRAYGGLDHPNMLGGVLAVGMLLVLYSRQQTTDDRRQIDTCLPAGRDDRRREIIMFWIIWIIMFIALFFTFSRAAWLGFGVGFGVVFVYYLIKKNLEIIKKLSWIILISGVLFFSLATIYDDLFNTRINSEARLETRSTSERVAGYKEAEEMIKNNWLFGVGAGNYILNTSDTDIMYKQPVHNIFLLIWAEIGIFGLMFFITCCLLSVVYPEPRRRVCCLRKLKNKPDALINLSVLFALFIIATFDHWLWSLHFGVLLFWFIMGLILRNASQET